MNWRLMTMVIACSLASMLWADEPEQVVADTMATDTIPVPDIPRYRLDLIMPFHVGNSAPSAQEERLNEFYRGVIMALHETPQQDSIFVDLYVHNSKRDTAAVAALLRDSTLEKTNGIIGPFYPEQVELLSPWIREHRVPTILPVTSDEHYLTDNPYLMQYNTTPEQERKAVIEYFLSSDQRLHCVFIEDSIMDASNRMMRNAIRKSGISNSAIASQAVLHDSLLYALRANAENIIFFPTNKYQRNRAYMAKIQALYPEHKMAVYGVFSWLKEQISVPLIYTSTFVTEQELDMKKYDAVWKKYFKMQHAVSYPRYDLLGYDITRKMIGLLTNKRYPGAQSDIDFEPYAEGGALINAHIEVLRAE